MNIHIPADFTLSELEAFIDGERPEAPVGFYTTREWADHLGISIKRTRALLRRAKEKGLLNSQKGSQETLDGRMQPRPIYALQKKLEEK